MPATEHFEIIARELLLPMVRALHARKYRLVQISATRLPDALELTYTFDKEGVLVNLRLSILPQKASVPSITSTYWCAFLYENELHDLFDLQVDGLAVDFHGHLYETAIPFPFGSTKPPAKPAAAAVPVEA